MTDLGGNPKGVMLATRPNDSKSSAPPASASNGTHPVSRGGVTSAFVSTVVPPEILGLNPIKRELPVSRQSNDLTATVTHKHKRWLAQFQEAKLSQAEATLAAAEDKAAAKVRFQEAQARKRAAIRGDELEAPLESMNASPMPDTVSVSPDKKATQPKKNTKLPAWALSEQAAEELEEAEVNELLAFTENLDFDTYMDEMEMREALKVVEEQVKDLEAKERLYAPRPDFGEEGAGGAEQGEQWTQANATKLANLRRKMQQIQSRIELERPDWDPSTKVGAQSDGTVDQLFDENSQLRKTHSRMSAKRLVEQVRKQTNMQKTASGDPYEIGGNDHGIIISNPVVATHNDGAQGPKKTRASNLPFLYRHPAI